MNKINIKHIEDKIAYMNWIDSAHKCEEIAYDFNDKSYLMEIYPFSDYMQYVRPEELKQ
tara:strand:- start:506 stop:682 length:177 start_codon:yes stop_codon:yes gene_type:complete